MFLALISAACLLLMCIREKLSTELMDRALNGDEEAQFRVGQCYIFGDGVDTDYDMAMLWLQKAAYQGHAEAQFYIGLLFFNGHGVEKDIDQANKWFSAAEENGFRNAKRILRIITLGYDESLYGCGDGSSVDNAVKINTCDMMLGIRAEYKYIDQVSSKRGLSYMMFSQALLSTNGRRVDKLDIIWEDGQRESFFFDVTGFCILGI